MGLKTSTIPAEARIAAVKAAMIAAKYAVDTPGSDQTYLGLKAVLGDLEANIKRPPNVVVQEIDYLLEALKASQTDLGYDTNRLADLGNYVIGRWPIIRQALEHFEREFSE